MNDVLDRLRDIIQNDVGHRGLRTDPQRNLINACPDDFRLACRSLAEHPAPSLAVVTGFFIPTATPPAGETDGPLGALYLARALVPLGIPVTIITDDFCMRAIEAGVGECRLRKSVPVVTLPSPAKAKDLSDAEYCSRIPKVTHLLAIERVGPSRADNTCRNMRGREITDLTSPAHRLLSEPEALAKDGPNPSLTLQALKPTTIGIGDGGNEIGMGKIPWDVIERNIPNGRQVACRVPTDHLIVCGVSNWGAYALAAGVALLRGKKLDASLFDPVREREILQAMVEEGPLVDGVTGKQEATVDGLTWEQYADVLVRIKKII